MNRRHLLLGALTAAAVGNEIATALVPASTIDPRWGTAVNVIPPVVQRAAEWEGRVTWWGEQQQQPGFEFPYEFDPTPYEPGYSKLVKELSDYYDAHHEVKL